jgi:hypothetical protein
MEAAARNLVIRTRGYVIQGRPSKQSTFSAGEICQQPKTPGTQLFLHRNPRLQVQQFKFLITQMGFADLIRSPGKPAEDCFITMIWKKRGDVRADKTSDHNKIARQFWTSCTEYVILL